MLISSVCYFCILMSDFFSAFEFLGVLVGEVGALSDFYKAVPTG